MLDFIFEDGSKYLQIEYKAMHVKIVEYEEGEVNLKTWEHQSRIKKSWWEFGNHQEETKGELSLTNEVEVNNLVNIKGELEEGWRK